MTAHRDELDFTHRFEPGEDPAGPTLLLLHGTGGDENDLLPFGRMLAPGANLLSPRGKVLENGMPRFFKRLAMGVFDEDDLRAQTHTLADFVAEAANHYGFDAEKLIAVGYSNGANIAASVLLLRPGTLVAAVLLHAQTPLEVDPTPDLSGTSVFLSGGRRDHMIAPEETERLAKVLEQAGARVELSMWPGGHELSSQEVEAARAWVETITSPSS